MPVAAAVLLLCGCSTLPPEYDPVTQAGNAKRAVLGWFGDEQPPPPNIAPPPAEGRPIPNLATVPPPPLVTTGQREERQKEMSALQADRAAAAKADAALRAHTTPPAAGEPGTTSSPPPPSPLAPAAAPAPSPPASQSPASDSKVVMPQYGVNSLPDSLLPSTPVGAGPAPVVELPSLPETQTRVAAGLLTTSERHGTVSFAPGAVTLSAAGRNTLDGAAASAIENNGRIRLVPAREANAEGAPAPGLADRRAKALREALAGTGLSDDRVAIEDGVRRADAYDVFVDY